MAVQPAGQQPESPLDWLEEELRQTKARLHKVEHELEQALKQAWSLDAEMRKLTEALASSGAATAALAGFKEDLRQLRDQMSRAHDRQTALANRTEEVLRQQQAGVGRDRQERAGLAREMDALARGVEQYESRMQALEETARHVDEQVAGARLAHQAAVRDVEELESRSARATEALVRLEHEVSRVGGETEELRSRDEAAADRMKLLQEQLRRLEERLDKLDAIAAFPREMKELLHRERFEREHLGERVVAIERVCGELTERVQEFVQGLARLDQRSQAQATSLLALAEQLQELGEATRGQTKRLMQVVLRQRRRQAEALAQEIKELSQGELNSGD